MVLPNANNFTIASILSLKKSTLRKVTDLLNDKLTYHSTTILFEQWYLLALDIIESKLCKQPPTKPVRK